MNKRMLAVLLIGAVLTAIAFYFYYGIYKIVYVHFDVAGSDSSKGFYAASNFLEGRSVFAMPKDVNPYYYPPLSILVFLPFYKFSLYHARMAWFILSHILILFSAYAIYKYGRRKNKMYSAAAAAVALFFSMPLYQTVLTGNINILIFAGVCLVYSSVISGKGNLIPLILAVCSYLKIYPAILMAAFVRKRNYGLCKRFFLFVVLFGILSIGIFGLASHNVFIQQLCSASKFVGMFHAMSFTFFMKLFLPDRYEKLILWGNLIFLLLLLKIWWKKSKVYSGAPSNDASTVIDLFVLTTIMVLVFPSAWTLYHAFFIIPFYFIAFALLESKNQLKYSGVFVVLFLVISFWEIIYYQLPLSVNLLTIRDIDLNRNAFPVLYPFIFSLHFVLNVVFFFWLLANYKELRRIVESCAGEPDNRFPDRTFERTPNEHI